MTQSNLQLKKFRICKRHITSAKYELHINISSPVNIRRSRRGHRQVANSANSGTVDFVNHRKIRIRTKNGKTYFLSQDCQDLNLLPGDRVDYVLRTSSRTEKTEAFVDKVERCSSYLVVAQISDALRRRIRSTQLVPIGLPGISNIQISPDSVPQGLHGKHLLVELSRGIASRSNLPSWKFTALRKVLETPKEIANAVAMTRFGIHEQWPETVTQELGRINREIPKSEIKSRIDLRSYPFVTIDPPSAKDYDDAIFCDAIAQNKYRLMVAIADVGHYVGEGSQIDKQAFARGTSLYLPGYSIPMLPDKLSGDLCSLLPGKDRLALVCDMTVLSNGEIESYSFIEAVINSRLRLNYQGVSENRIENFDADVTSSLRNLFHLNQCFIANRENRNVLNLNIPEPVLKFDQNHCVSEILYSQKQVSHSLVEEAMLAANVCAAKFISENYSNEAMYRVHEAPSSSSANEFGCLTGSLGLYPTIRDKISLQDYAEIIDQIRDDGDLLSALQMHLLRSLSTAIYSQKSAPHFALNYPLYTHFTSPIRRYPDLVVHRMIKSVVSGSGFHNPTNQLSLVATEASYQERRAESCSREADKWMITGYMRDYIGEVYDGVIVDVKRYGVFVQLDSPFIDGLVSVENLGIEYFRYNRAAKQLVGTQTGRTYRIGMRLSIWVSGVDQELGTVDFELIHSSKGKRRGRRKKHKGRR